MYFNWRLTHCRTLASHSNRHSLKSASFWSFLVFIFSCYFKAASLAVGETDVVSIQTKCTVGPVSFPHTLSRFCASVPKLDTPWVRFCMTPLKPALLSNTSQGSGLKLSLRVKVVQSAGLFSPSAFVENADKFYVTPLL